MIIKTRKIDSALIRKGFVKKELENFINCPLSEEEYISMLMDKSVIY